MSTRLSVNRTRAMADPQSDRGQFREHKAPSQLAKGQVHPSQTVVPHRCFEMQGKRHKSEFESCGRNFQSLRMELTDKRSGSCNPVSTTELRSFVCRHNLPEDRRGRHQETSAGSGNRVLQILYRLQTVANLQSQVRRMVGNPV